MGERRLEIGFEIGVDMGCEIHLDTCREIVPAIFCLGVRIVMVVVVREGVMVVVVVVWGAVMVVVK